VLITLVRIAFVLLAAIIGFSSGKYFYRPLFGDGLPPWFGAAIGFSVAITLIAAEQAFRRRFTRSLVAFLVGLGAGLAMSALLLAVLRQVLQDDDLYRNLDLPLALTATYLVLITVLRNADRLRVIVPFAEFRNERSDGGALVLDHLAPADGRLPALLAAGFTAPRVLVHRRILEYWQGQVASEDTVARARAQRALDGIQALRRPGLPPVEIDDTEIPNASELSELVLRLARLENGRVVAVDRDLARRCAAEGVPMVDLGALARAMSPDVAPGSVLTLLIERAGEVKGQGVGFLDDGSMVVVSGAGEAIGQSVRCTVRRLHSTANGRMVFAE
jgi:uncharacterized protein YacL